MPSAFSIPRIAGLGPVNLLGGGIPVEVFHHIAMPEIKIDLVESAVYSGGIIVGCIVTCGRIFTFTDQEF
jgi:hypothetical protein